MPRERPEFIRLSDREGRPVYLAVGEIASFACWLDGAIVRTRDRVSFEVCETPEAIIELVMGPKDEDEDPP